MQDVGPYGDIISSTSTALFFFQGINNGLRYLSQGVLNLNRSKKRSVEFIFGILSSTC